MNTATRHKAVNRFFRDLPEGARVEFKYRVSRNYVLPEWVKRPLSPIFEERRAKREAVKLARNVARCDGCE